MRYDDYGSGVGVAQILGKRDVQQDDFGCIVNENSSLLVLADGMGGHKSGEKASQLVVEEFLQIIDPEDDDNILSRYDLAFALSKVNSRISSLIENDPSLSGMGTTVVVLFKHSSDILWLSVGDSHLYIYRDKSLTKLNEDHSMKPLIMDLVSAGKLSKEDVHSHPLRNQLRSAISGREVELVDCPESSFECQKDDIFLLCSDGIDVLAENEIAKILLKKRKKTSVEISRAIVQAVDEKKRQDQDNTTVAILKVS